jgi:1-aminocyclopropane-1-carboxylate deaminase/D-cysteine desulfhydrase-like pyridoxal-dependent ACC family enzyme
MSQEARGLTTAELRRAVDPLPRVKLGHLPTPLEELPRFSAALGGPPVWIKRDDCSGLAFGGNKTRHNEFIFGHALEQGAEMLVWGAGVQSNNCRQTAAACARLGLGCHLLLSRAHHGTEIQGNLLLDYLLGATVEFVDAPLGPDLNELIAARADEFRARGHHVYCWDPEVCKPRASLSYALCLAEIVEQLGRQNSAPGAIYLCSAGSTGAGMLLGRAALGLDLPIRLIAPLLWPWDMAEDLADTANATAELAGLSCRVAPAKVDVSDAYIGPKYGAVTPECLEAIRLLARTEGILLEPVYTGKALAALIDDIRRRRLPLDRPVVFVHTGGTPALFAYRDELIQGLA